MLGLPRNDPRSPPVNWHTLTLTNHNIAPGITRHTQRPKKSPQSHRCPSPRNLQGNQNNRPREPYKSHFSPRKLDKDCPLAPGNWTIMQCKKPSRPKEAQEQKPCISAFLMKLYLRLCPREARIPEKNIDAINWAIFSRAERGGHTTPGAFSAHATFVSNARSGDIPLSYRRRMMAL